MAALAWGGTGVVQYSGPGTIAGTLDFSAADSGQFNNNNSQNVGPSSVNYSVAAVTSALITVNSLSSPLSGLGTNLAMKGVRLGSLEGTQRLGLDGLSHSRSHCSFLHEFDAAAEDLRDSALDSRNAQEGYAAAIVERREQVNIGIRCSPHAVEPNSERRITPAGRSSDSCPRNAAITCSRSTSLLSRCISSRVKPRAPAFHTAS